MTRTVSATTEEQKETVSGTVLNPGNSANAARAYHRANPLPSCRPADLKTAALAASRRRRGRSTPGPSPAPLLPGVTVKPTPDPNLKNGKHTDTEPYPQ
eukprot:382269-Hanusia_phi.AAC.1